MKIFDTEDKLKEFQINYEIKPKNNNFYVVAQDRKEMIISTVLHTLPYSRIINNNELNDEIISRFKKYAKDIRFKICNDETPPNDYNNKATKEDSQKNQDIKNSLKKSDIPKDIADKIKKMNDNPSF